MDTIGLVRSRKLLRVLFDPGSTVTMVKKSIVPETVVPKTLSGDKTVKTIAGKMNANQMVHLHNARLPEFDKNCKISMQKSLIFMVLANMTYFLAQISLPKLVWS